MNLSGLLPILHKRPAFAALLADSDDGGYPPQALLSSARAFVAAGLAVHRPGALVYLTGSSEDAHRLVERLAHFLPPTDEDGPPIHLLAEPDALPYERIVWSDRTRQSRLTALAALQSRSGPDPIVVASVPALMQKTLPARELRLSLRPLRVGSYLRLEEVTVQWAQTGYNSVEVVEEPGTFARRGGIVDIWPPNLPHPIRIDLFGDEVDSLRVFDPATQRTEHYVERIEIGPGSEALSKYGPKALERMAADVREETGKPLLEDPKLLLAIREELRQEVDRLQEGHSFRGLEWYLPYFYSNPANLLDYLPDPATLVVDDGTELMAVLQATEQQAEQLQAELTRTGELPAGFASSFFDADTIQEQLLQCQPLILGFGDLYGKSHSANTALARTFVPGPRFGGETKQIVRDVAKLVESDQRVVLISRQAARLQELLMDAEIVSHVQADLTQPPVKGVTLLQGILNEGFVLRGTETGNGITPPDSANTTLNLLTDTELFGWKKASARKRRKPQSQVAPELFFADVQPGDYVVHMEHGIGQYEGLVKLELGGGEKSAREYLQVNYAQGDKLYVPVHQADRLSRYVGAGESHPPISRLGTADWQMVKERAQKAVADIAEDLLALYAERELVKGHAYSPDGPWQEEMEENFPFQETEDQIQAIEEVKQDMESAQPMDRLICGDVGYGKTEVAVRAAFKAVVDGKQVAMLVPTTVLAQQHYRTFSRRLAQFPVRVEMLSRFRTPAQQNQVLQGLQEGSVDIVVGTHRLLSEDLEFKDLGLLIVDEEQRFGVAHKERLKQLRTQVDVLTLSATPIPRTLHMSLSGVRDMSVINTPPRERLPVRTVLSEYDEVLVRQAIQRELDREGQVFFVHNRVRGIEHIANRLRRLVPEAVVGVAHGQMAERRLEEMMMRFAEGEIDILVSTTIVENGLDIRNANTMIINRADKFGLAQLYQLRGRVGRGAVRGYCYLLYDKHKSLTFDARRRLEALLESSEELGAGFRIAMRDLEIRGAGELLGARQHGQIATVGFDLYTRLLAQAINDLKEKKARFEVLEGRNGQGIPEPTQPAGPPESRPERGEDESPLPFALDDPLAPPVTLDLPILAEIPATYVAEENLRLQLYRRVAGLTSRSEIDVMRQELIDRFGTDPETDSVPEAVENLFFQIWVKILALKAGIPNVGRRRDQIAIRTEEELGDKARRALQQKLRLGLGRIGEADEQFIAEESVHVGREAVYLPIDEEGRWRDLLVHTLEIMADE